MPNKCKLINQQKNKKEKQKPLIGRGAPRPPPRPAERRQIQVSGLCTHCSPTSEGSSLLLSCFWVLLIVQVPAQMPPPQRPPWIPVPKVSTPETRAVPSHTHPCPVRFHAGISRLRTTAFSHVSPSARGSHKPRASCTPLLWTPGWVPGGRKQTPRVPPSPAQPRAAAACLRALHGTGRLAHGRGTPGLAPDSGRAAGGARTIPTINRRCRGGELPRFKSQLRQL